MAADIHRDSSPPRPSSRENATVMQADTTAADTTRLATVPLQPGQAASPMQHDAADEPSSNTQQNVAKRHGTPEPGSRGSGSGTALYNRTREIKETAMTGSELISVKQRFGIIGNSEALNTALEIALRVAPTDLSVLVTGESGVGKEFFPQVIHPYSARKHNKYIAVNCGAIPEGTIDSELFGHEKGSFTGAIDARKGYFEGGRRRHNIPRRGRRAAALDTGTPAARAANGRVHTRGVEQGAEDQR